MIVFEKVVKNYDGKERIEVLKGIDLEIKVGEWVSVLGPSGCGKSTLLNLAACLLKPSSGRITIAGQDTAFMDERQLTRIRSNIIGFIFQGAYLLPALTVLDNVMLPGKFKQDKKGSHKNDHARAVKLLNQFELGDQLKRLPYELSYGQKRRVAIARALFNQPEIILADEPTNDLDSSRADQVAEILQSLHKEGYTILMVTHNSDLSSMATRQLKIHDGLIKSAI